MTSSAPKTMTSPRPMPPDPRTVSRPVTGAAEASGSTMTAVP